MLGRVVQGVFYLEPDILDSCGNELLSLRRVN